MVFESQRKWTFLKQMQHYSSDTIYLNIGILATGSVNFKLSLFRVSTNASISSGTRKSKTNFQKN